MAMHNRLPGSETPTSPNPWEVVQDSLLTHVQHVDDNQETGTTLLYEFTGAEIERAAQDGVFAGAGLAPPGRLCFLWNKAPERVAVDAGANPEDSSQTALQTGDVVLVSLGYETECIKFGAIIYQAAVYRTCREVGSPSEYCTVTRPKSFVAREVPLAGTPGYAAGMQKLAAALLEGGQQCVPPARTITAPELDMLVRLAAYKPAFGG
jgi:hypothetical protein